MQMVYYDHDSTRTYHQQLCGTWSILFRTHMANPSILTNETVGSTACTTYHLLLQCALLSVTRSAHEGVILHYDSARLRLMMKSATTLAT